MGIMRSDDKSWNSVATRAVEALEMVMPGDDLARAAQIVTRTIEENDIRSLVKVPIEQMRRLKKALKTRKKRVTHYGHYSTDGTNSCEHYAR